MIYLLFLIKRAWLIALVVGVMLLLGGCKAKSAELQTLENAAAIIQPRTGQEADRLLHDKRSGILAKPSYAEIYLEYEPVKDHTKREVFEEIRVSLLQNQWMGGNETIIPDYFTATTKQENSTLIVTVLIVSDKNLVVVKFINQE